MRDTDTGEPMDADFDQDNESHMQLQVQRLKLKPDDTAEWLSDLAFWPYTQSDKNTSIQDTANSPPDSASSNIEGDTQERPFQTNESKQSQSVVTRNLSNMGMTIHDPGAVSLLIDELLADWTVLTEDEIKGIVNDRPDSERKGAEISKESQKKKEYIYLKDAVGRKFKFPFGRVQTWEVNPNPF